TVCRPWAPSSLPWAGMPPPSDGLLGLTPVPRLGRLGRSAGGPVLAGGDWAGGTSSASGDC
ncbi:MAG TPA: hypothetical protein VF162_20500, partial [Streptosporangiaceae bacterium]